jgi:hypothetical protein
MEEPTSASSGRSSLDRGFGDSNYCDELLNPFKLTWKDFNSNFSSTVIPLSPEERESCLQNPTKVIGLRYFMIESPFTARVSWKFQQVVELFRTMNLRSLPVLSEHNNRVVGIITRQDLFAFMTL